MPKTMERVISFLIAPLLLVGMGLLAVTQLPSANAEDSTSDKSVRIEILPEIFLKSGGKEVFAKPEETIGVGRSLNVYGGPPTGQVLEVWKNVAFQVFDQGGKLIETTKGTVGDNKRWGGAKYCKSGSLHPASWLSLVVHGSKIWVPGGYRREN